LALNVNMDLSPFTQINPCGYAGMEMTQIADFVQPCPAPDEVASKLTAHLETQLTPKADNNE
ncbi:TPA: octanoyltransferase, partial [Neisseria gonorrhoeae]